MHRNIQMDYSYRHPPIYEANQDEDKFGRRAGHPSNRALSNMLYEQIGESEDGDESEKKYIPKHAAEAPRDVWCALEIVCLVPGEKIRIMHPHDGRLRMPSPTERATVPDTIETAY